MEVKWDGNKRGVATFFYLLLFRVKNVNKLKTKKNAVPSAGSTCCCLPGQQIELPTMSWELPGDFGHGIKNQEGKKKIR